MLKTKYCEFRRPLRDGDVITIGAALRGVILRRQCVALRGPEYDAAFHVGRGVERDVRGIDHRMGRLVGRDEDLDGKARAARLRPRRREQLVTAARLGGETMAWPHQRRCHGEGCRKQCSKSSMEDHEIAPRSIRIAALDLGRGDVATDELRSSSPAGRRSGWDAPGERAARWAQVASGFAVHYIGGAGLRGAFGDKSPGPYRSLRELSLAEPLGSVTWRPPTCVGNPGSSSPTAIAAPHSIFPIEHALISVMAGLVRPSTS